MAWFGPGFVAKEPDLNGPASATVIFTAAVIAADSIGSRLRAQAALATQTVVLAYETGLVTPSGAASAQPSPGTDPAR